MTNYKLATIDQASTVKQAMQSLQSSNLGICLVVNEKNILLGVITDGDIRRGLLNAISLEEKCTRVMAKSPKFMAENSSNKQVLKQMEKTGVQHMPLLNKNGEVVDLLLYKNLIKHEEYENIVFINAGGLGKRLLPLTENCPKPLLSVGNRPILENIIDNFQKDGFKNFYLSVNYKANMIKDHFGDGSKWGVQITYVNEVDPLGTAGSIAALQNITELPILVSNADLLTNVDYQGLLDFHKKSKAVATMCVREHDFQVSYGVVEIENGKMASISEKPVHKYFINAGIYVLNPQALHSITLGEKVDMPELLERLRKKHPSDGVAVFPIHEYWLDVGRIEDFQRAQDEIAKWVK